MKELKSNDDQPIIAAHYPISRNYRIPKRWVVAQSSSAYQQKKGQNSCVEAAYHRIIKAVKEQLQPNEIYYERDMKTDSEAGFLAMHSFITSSFYWRLDCGFCYDYEVTYAFSNCPFEAEIRSLMRGYPLDRTATQKDLQPDFKTFYETVLKVQEPKHIPLIYKVTFRVAF